MASEPTKPTKVRPGSNKTSYENTASSDRVNVWGRRPGPVTVSMEDTLTQSRMSELELASLTPAGLQEAHMLAQSSYTGLGMAESDYSEMGDSLSLVTDIGPSSIMMDNLPSFTQPRPGPRACQGGRPSLKAALSPQNQRQTRLLSPRGSEESSRRLRTWISVLRGPQLDLLMSLQH